MSSTVGDSRCEGFSKKIQFAKSHQFLLMINRPLEEREIANTNYPTKASPTVFGHRVV